MARIPESEFIINSDGSAFHLHILPEELADTVLVAGDPGRITMIASFFDKGSIEFDRQSREFHTITGKYHGRRITALSTGIGTDNIDIVMTELDALANIDFKTREVKKEKKRLTILRIGTCGAVQPYIPLGGYVFSEISVGFDGLLNWYAGREKVAMKGIEEAFMKYMDWKDILPHPYFVKSSPKLLKLFKDCTIQGMTMSAPGFYGPQGRTVRLKLTYPKLTEQLNKFEYEGHKFTNIEMESSAIASLAALMGHDAATVCCAIANRYVKDSEPNYQKLVEGLIIMVLNKLTE